MVTVNFLIVIAFDHVAHTPDPAHLSHSFIQLPLLLYYLLAKLTNPLWVALQLFTNFLLLPCWIWVACYFSCYHHSHFAIGAIRFAILWSLNSYGLPAILSSASLFVVKCSFLLYQNSHCSLWSISACKTFSLPCAAILANVVFA